MKRKRIACAFFIGAALLVFKAFAQNFSQPPIGELCPPAFAYDGANCFLATAPSGSAPTIIGNRFAHNATICSLSGFGQDPSAAAAGRGATAGKCYRQVPAGYTPFVYNGSFYVEPNAHFVKQLQPVCPPKSTFDNSNCFFSSAPSGHTASLDAGKFVFDKTSSETCSYLWNDSAEVTPTTCTVGTIPSGYTPFIYNNGWYVVPHFVFQGDWLARDYMSDTSPPYVRPVCLPPQGAQKNWQLIWSDEFDDQPDNKLCYTSNDHVQCIVRPEWSVRATCAGAPTTWASTAISGWTAGQIARFSGVRQLNKCTWAVYDSLNTWDIWNDLPMTIAERTNSYKAENITVANGILKMKTSQHPSTHYDSHGNLRGDGYCCGRQTETDLQNNAPLYTKDCPYSGAMIMSRTGLPGTQGNSPNDPNPDKRYTGYATGFGRVEFRARVTKIGHGTWPALWLFTDQDPNGERAFEMDVLEYVADVEGQSPPGAPNASVAQGLAEQIKLQSSTYGLACQTTWDYEPEPVGTIGKGIALPISLTEWHIYAVEFESSEVRFYTDSCLTSRVHDGQQVISRWDATQTPKTFHVPKAQTFHILIDNLASAAPWFPSWYRTYGKQTDACGNNWPNCMNTDAFESTEFEVDYVRVYQDPNAPHLLPSPDPHRPSRATQVDLSRLRRRAPFDRQSAP